MMALIAINPKCRDDPFVRYKMPIPKVSYQSKNGGETLFLNASLVASSFDRPLNELKIFFAKKFDVRVVIKDNVIIFSGQITVSMVSEALDSYIASKVLCQVCENPETFINQKGKLECKACGHLG
jgi:translation initiation factor 2 beta subunit (eIF-2beta)/eIF-5